MRKLRPMKTTFVAISALLTATLTTIAGVTVDLEAIPNKTIFGIDFGNGREYYGRVDSVNSVSMQEYVVPGFRVYEMNIDMRQGNSLLRIYSVVTMDPAQEARNATDSLTSQVPFGTMVLDSMQEGYNLATVNIKQQVDDVAAAMPVMKDYPMTTHAKTIEYKVASPLDVKELFKQMKNSWLQKPTVQDAATQTRTETTNGTSTGNNANTLTTQEEEIVPLNGALYIVR